MNLIFFNKKMYLQKRILNGFMKNFLSFPFKVIFEVSLEQFAPLRSANAVRRSKQCTT